MREEIKDPARLEHILEAIENVKAFMTDKNLKDLENDKMLYFAVVKNIEIIGEASYKLSNTFKAKYSMIPWRQIEKMRHVLVHGYYSISPLLLYNVYIQDIPVLKEYIESIRDKL